MTNVENIKFPSWFYFEILSEEGNECCFWVPTDKMTKEEKKNYKTHETTGGYLKVSKIEKDMKVHWRRAFDSCDDLEDIRKTFEIPNFDYEIFEEISGISKEDFEKKLGTGEVSNEFITVNGVKYKRLEEIE